MAGNSFQYSGLTSMIIFCILIPCLVLLVLVFLPVLILAGLIYSIIAPHRLRGTFANFHTAAPFWKKQPNNHASGATPRHAAAGDEIDVSCEVIESVEVDDAHTSSSQN